MNTKSIPRDAARLWRFIHKEGGLDLARYDDGIESAMMTELTLMGKAPNASLDDLLRQGTVSVEELLVVFFRSVEPYATMMAELLKFFEQAGAKHGKDNLCVQFDFSESQTLGLDLNHFREQTRRWVEVVGQWTVNAWDSSHLWDLNGALRREGWRDGPLADPRVLAWRAAYYANGGYGRFADIDLTPPKSGNPELDQILLQVWAVWQSVVRALKGAAPDRNTLHDWRRRNVVPSDRLFGLWRANVIVPSDHDHWAGSLADGAYAVAEAVAARPQKEQSQFVTPIIAKLRDIFATVPTKVLKGSNFVLELSEILNLPIWQRRHELYSAWVATRITGALHDLGPEIHAPEGMLAFGFKGAQLATFTKTRSPLHLWAELRTPLVRPRGHSRKGGIQPDYSLVRDTPDSLGSVFVVECKQYWKQSVRNFSDALNDYAAGRPNAHVVLVNYGPISAGLLQKVDVSLRVRTFFVGDFRPARTAALTEFHDLLRKAIVPVFGIPAALPSPIASIPQGNVVATAIPLVEAPAAEATLVWGDEPSDLDLHLRIGREEHICYSRLGMLHAAPWAKLELDERNGRGPEVIRIARWFDRPYTIAVHAFSAERPLRASRAVITLTLGRDSHRFACPTMGEGDWWLVCTYEPATGKLDVLNRIGTEIGVGSS